MFRQATAVLFPFLLLIVGFASDSPKAYNDWTVVETVEGSWRKTTIESSEGRRLLPRVVFEEVDTFQDGIWTLADGKRSKTGTYSIDTGHSPNQLDITIIGSNGRGQTHKYIYLLRDDTLRIGYALSGDDRPKSLDENGILIETYKRVDK